MNILTVVTLKKDNNPIAGYNINSIYNVFKVYNYKSPNGCNLHAISKALNSFTSQTFNNHPLTVLVQDDVLVRTITAAFKKTNHELTDWVQRNSDRECMLDIINTIHELRNFNELSNIHFGVYDNDDSNVITLKGKINVLHDTLNSEYANFNNNDTKDISF